MRSLPRVKCLWTSRDANELAFVHCRRVYLLIATTRAPARKFRRRRHDDAFAGVEAGEHFDAVAVGAAGRNGPAIDADRSTTTKAYDCLPSVLIARLRHERHRPRGRRVGVFARRAGTSP